MKMDDFITKRYDDIIILIKKINTQNNSRKSPELITDLWLELRKRCMFVNSEKDYWFFSVKYISNRLKWKDGFDIEINENGEIKYKTHKKVKKVELDFEFEKELDIIDNNDRLTPQQKLNVEKVHRIYEKMDFYDKQLYELYFDDNLSVDKITVIFNNKGVPISRSSVYNMIKELIEKIKNEV